MRWEEEREVKERERERERGRLVIKRRKLYINYTNCQDKGKVLHIIIIRILPKHYV